MNNYNVTLIGCGYMGAEHLKSISGAKNIKIHCVCDVRKERAAEFCEKYNANCYETDWKIAVASEETDIVIIATYPSSHLDILKECIKNGKHILLEKPISNNIEGGREIIELIKSNPQCKVLIGYILRHNETYKRVANMIKNGDIGFPIVFRMIQNHRTDDWEKYRNLICDTSPIFDCGVHYLDVMRWFTGAEIIDISGDGICIEPDLPKGKYNYGMINVKLSDGSLGYYEAGWGHTVRNDLTKEFIGPLGSIKITYRIDRQSKEDKGNMIEYYSLENDKTEVFNVPYCDKPTLEQLYTLIDMIENNTVKHPTIEDVWQSFSWAEKADKIIKQKLIQGGKI